MEIERLHCFLVSEKQTYLRNESDLLVKYVSFATSNLGVEVDIRTMVRVRILVYHYIT